MRGARMTQITPERHIKCFARETFYRMAPLRIRLESAGFETIPDVPEARDGAGTFQPGPPPQALTQMFRARNIQGHAARRRIENVSRAKHSAPGPQRTVGQGIRNPFLSDFRKRRTL